LLQKKYLKIVGLKLGQMLVNFLMVELLIGYTSDSIQLICKLAPNPAINDNTAYFYLIENAVPTAHTNPDFYEDIEVVLYNKKDFLQLLQQNKILHGVQLGPIYEALIKLGWLQYT